MDNITIDHARMARRAQHVFVTMRAWPVARSIFDAPLGCEGSERADNRLDNMSLMLPPGSYYSNQSPSRAATKGALQPRAPPKVLYSRARSVRLSDVARPSAFDLKSWEGARGAAYKACVSTWLGEGRKAPMREKRTSGQQVG